MFISVLFHTLPGRHPPLMGGRRSGVASPTSLYVRLCIVSSSCSFIKSHIVNQLGCFFKDDHHMMLVPDPLHPVPAPARPTTVMGQSLLALGHARKGPSSLTRRPVTPLLFGTIMMDIQLILKVAVLDFPAPMKLWINQPTLVVDS